MFPFNFVPRASMARNSLSSELKVSRPPDCQMVQLRRRKYTRLNGWLNSTEVNRRYRTGCKTYTKVCLQTARYEPRETCDVHADQNGHEPLLIFPLHLFVADRTKIANYLTSTKLKYSPFSLSVNQCFDGRQSHDGSVPQMHSKG